MCIRDRFRTSGIYRVVAENAFYTGFEAITDSLDYVQPEPIGELQGVENHGHTNGAVRFVWADEAIVSVEKDGESIEYVSGQELTADGAYTVMLENYDGFRVVYEFVIDKTAPEIKLDGVEAVSYTHLDVYKRQTVYIPLLSKVNDSPSDKQFKSDPSSA